MNGSDAMARAEMVRVAALRWAAATRDVALRHPRPVRVLLAGPGVLAATAVTVLGMVLWLPLGAAGIDQIAIPLILLPLVWTGLFFHACLDPSLRRVALVLAALAIVNGLALVWHFHALPAGAAP
jgi:hypothetical protein